MLLFSNKSKKRGVDLSPRMGLDERINVRFT